MSSKVVSGSKGKKHGIGECTYFAMKSNIYYTQNTTLCVRAYTSSSFSIP